jgi:hypothetical protein
MPEWERLVAERLAHTELTPEVRREVVAEIAAHLREHCDELRRTGSPNSEAVTLAQVQDWNALSRNIRRSKEDRMSFARKVIMPGIAAVIVALAAFKFFVWMLVPSLPCEVDAATVDLVTNCVTKIVSADGPAYLPWLATLPLAGGLAAALARRLGARSKQRILAAVFPAIYFAFDITLISVFDTFYWRVPVYWAVIPAVVCAIGALPFLSGRRDPTEPAPSTQHLAPST